MAAIFVSHSSRDNDLARDVKTWLVGQGYEQVFLDFDKHTGLQAGEQWEQRLYREIERCHAVILILTTNWLESKWCFVEFTQARALGKTIFPVVSGPLGGTLVAPEIQGVDLENWDGDGKDHLRRRIRAISDESARGFPWDRSRSPYPGIHAFEAEDAAIFFGRDPEIRDLGERLEARRVQGGKRLLLVVAASGSGKSSLVKAGVLPKLARERRRWIVLPVFRSEREPLANLAKALAERAGQADRWRVWRGELVGSGGLSFLKSVADDLRIGEARDATLLVTIDQFEELFTVSDPEERDGILALLDRLAEPGSGLPVLVLGTVRSDVLGDLLREKRFACAFDDYPLRPMPVDRLPKVIEGPAAVHALSLERGLAARITSDAATAEALPLLAFTLRELYERHGADARLSLADYERLGDRESGLTPIENAVRRRADDVIRLDKPTDAELAALRNAFVYHLVRVRDDGVFVRQPARSDALPAGAGDLIDRFSEARLLSRFTRPDDTGVERSVVEVAHEALLKAWPLLTGWLDEERAFLAAKVQIAKALDEWRRTPKPRQKQALLQGVALDRAEQFRASHPGGFSSGEIAFIRASWREAKRRRRRIAMLALGAAVLLIAAIAPRLYVEYGRRTARECDLHAAEEDVTVNVPVVPFEKINTALAIPACEKAVALESDNPRLLNNLGRSYDAAGRFAEANATYRRAVALGYGWAQNNLGVNLLIGRGETDFAGGVALIRAAFQQGVGLAEDNYTRTDYASWIAEEPRRVEIVREGLVTAGRLSASSVSDWNAVVLPALEGFKRTKSIADEGVTLRTLDELGIVQTLSDVLARARQGDGK